MNFSKIGAYLRQPTSLIAIAVIVGTGVADWFGILPESASVTLLLAVIPLLASDNSGMLSRLVADRDALAGVVHALTTHKDIGPAAAKVVAETVPSGALLSVAASALTVQPKATASSKPAGNGVAALMLLGVLSTGLMACGTDQIIQRQQAVYALGESYVIAAKLAVAYEQNPAADPAVVSKIKDAFTKAHDQIKPLQVSAKNGDPLNDAVIVAAQDALAAARKLLPLK